MKSAGSKVVATIFLATTAIMWGISYLFTKVAVENLPPMFLALLRFLLAVSILYPLSLKERKRLKFRVSTMLAGSFGVTLYFFFENYGLKYTSPSDASIIVSAAPILTLIFYDILHKKFDFPEYLGTFIAFVGVVLIIYNGKFSESSSLLGNFLAFGAAISWTGYTYFFDRTRDASLTANIEVMLWGIAFTLPFALFEVLSDPAGIHFSVSAIGGVLYLGIFASALGYFLWGKGIHLWGGKAATLWVYTIPIFTIIGDIFVLHYRPGTFFIIGALAVSTGMVTVILRQLQRLPD
ncbi:multidrug transporter [Kosmotoga arenicorallina S304]|uniref:Multidrug transporter n=1 Tax=Kosmotoga arenicorallina S304 TaxID=1453497 RepID=A0A176K289_9BACT|nr:DMT family transporter [Kosmotoga arenicorallina]OAA31181.1 multidrug transporter [Kosmotoga arenicorallina S304]